MCPTNPQEVPKVLFSLIKALEAPKLISKFLPELALGNQLTAGGTSEVLKVCLRFFPLIVFLLPQPYLV